jgi:hypothetical protein
MGSHANVDDLCERIKRNDPSLLGEICNIPVFRHCQLRPILAALPKSTVVTSLNFDLKPYLYNECDIRRLLHYLSETKLIQRVSLTTEDHDPPSPYTAGQLVGAVAENAQLELVEFSCSYPLCPHQPLLDLLRNKASSLRHLKLRQHYVCDYPTWPDHDVAVFASALGAMSMLESLTLDYFPNPELSGLALNQLVAHTRLRRLSITGYRSHYHSTELTKIASHHAIVTAVVSMLQSRVPIEVLELIEVSLSQEDTASLVQAMESCPTLAELALKKVSLNDEAKQELVRFLRIGRSSEACSIRRLCLSYLPEAPFPSILTVADNELQPTTTSIGSRLQALNLPSRLEDIDELLNVLVADEHRLSSLSLGSLTDTSWLQLTRCLPKMVHLREFHFEYLDKTHASTSDFVRAMQNNGSLHRVSEIKARGRVVEPQFSADEWQEIQSYCERNHKMRELLQDPYLPCDDTRACDDTREVNAKTLLALFPKLFHAMKPAERVAPTYILAGLLACGGGDSGSSSGGCLIGPSSHGKRLGSMLSDEPCDHYL